MRYHRWMSIAMLAVLHCPAVASADIGFPAAAAACRALVPGQKLMAMRQRTRNGVLVYEGDLSNVPPTDFTTVTLNLVTGALIDLGTAPMPPDERVATQHALQRLNYAGTDFAQAQAAANLAAARTDTERIELLYEGGILAFRVSYAGAPIGVEIDSITGAPIPAVIPGLGIEATVSVAEMAGAIAHAQWVAGINWIAIEAVAVQRFDGTTVKVLLANRVSGQLMRPEVVQGFYVPSPPFNALGAQVDRAAAVAIASPVVCTAIGALSSVQIASPGLGVNRLSVDPRPVGNAVTYEWVTGLVDATEVERDARSDATVPASRKSPSIGTPVDLVLGDLTRDGVVDARDLAEVLTYWGAVNPVLDVNESGEVDAGDLTVVLSGWTY